MEKKRMTFMQIFNMSFGFLGIQFGRISGWPRPSRV